MSGLPPEFGEKLVAFLPNLRRYAIALCRSADRADDLVQLTCERAIANAGSFEPGSRFDAWLFRILRNLWIDQLRRQKTAGPSEDIADHEDRLGADPRDMLDARAMLSAAWAGIERLPAEQREVLVLVCVEEFSYRDAADTLGVPIGTVMSRLARARAAIAAQLGIESSAKRSG